MTATLSDGAMQDRAHRLINRGLIALARDMAANGTPPGEIADAFITAGLMQIDSQQGDTFVMMDGISGHGQTIAKAFATWLVVAMMRHGEMVEPTATVQSARLQ